jgi:tetratricopeptide (TPR) repeat protein
MYMAVLSGWAALLPWLAWRQVYTAPIREVYFALTPMDFSYPTIVNKALWLSFPVLFLCWRLVGDKVNQWNFSRWKVIALNCLPVAVMTACGAYAGSDRRAEILNRMSFELQHGHPETVMALAKEYPSNNRLSCYLTNIALSESGRMPYSMFHYRQTGVDGLFLERRLSYSLLWHLGEIYYRLGMMPEAEHCAFEALVSSPKEPNVQTLRRLALTGIQRRDSAIACKYLRYLDRSLVYRAWAQQQRVNLGSRMADSAFQVPGAPTPFYYGDFFIDYQKPDNALLMLLQANPKHRMAFEYLMSCRMLQKDIEQVKWYMDQYFGNFDYPDIPVHYEEALMAYKLMMRAGDDFYMQYPVSQDTRKRFDRYRQAIWAAQSDKRNFERFEKEFGNTYWYYLHYIDPSGIQ